MEGAICIFLCMCLGHFCVFSQLILDVEPNVADVNENSNVVIRCSLNMLRPKTDVVYSIMIKRRGTTSAVLFKDGHHEITEEHISLENSRITNTLATLQIKVKNATCVDRGDYSCKMAVRRSYRNLQLGPVNSPLKVIGKPSGVMFNVDPQKTSYTDGEKVRVMCSTLQRTRISGWSWIIANQSKQDKMDTCVYSDDDCLYKCSSTISHHVSMDDENGVFVCSVEGMSANGTLDVTNASTSNVPTMVSTTRIYMVEYEISIGGSESESNQACILIVVLSIIAAIILLGFAMFSRGYIRLLKKPDLLTKGNNDKEFRGNLIYRMVGPIRDHFWSLQRTKPTLTFQPLEEKVQCDTNTICEERPFIKPSKCQTETHLYNEIT